MAAAATETVGDDAVTNSPHLATPPEVTFRCSCGVELTDEFLYWCKYCVELKCRNCVSQEIDSYFDTKNADEHMPSIEANTAKNRSTAGTMDCPVCPNVLNYVPFGEDGKLFLECGHCLWSSKGPGTIELIGTVDEIKAAVVAKMNSDFPKVYDELVEQYQVVAKEELRSLEAKRHTASQAIQRRIGGRGIYSKYSYKREGVQLTRGQYKEKELERKNKVFDETKNEWVEETDASKRAGLHAQSTKDVAPLDPATLMGLTSIDQLTSLEQRYQNLALQTPTAAEAWPVPHRLLGKRSKRCRECQHNLIKPELSAKSTRYKMQLFATSHVPQVRVVEVGKLVGQQRTNVVLRISNPIDQELQITLSAAMPHEQRIAARQAAKEAETAAKAAAAYDGEGVAVPSLRSGSAKEKDSSEYRVPPQTTEVRLRPLVRTTAELSMPGASLKLAAHDPLVALSAEEAPPEPGDDPCVLKRQGNRIIIKLPFVPIGDDGGDVVVAFDMSYKYKNVTAAFRSSQATETTPQVHEVVLPVQINFGPLATSA